MNCFFKLLSRLPLRLLQTVGAAVGELTFWLSPGYRRRTRENLRQAGYDEDELFRRAGRAAGRQALESVWLWYRPADEVMARVDADEETTKLVGDAMRSGRPIVFMTPHVGCFEVLPVWLADTFWEETKRSIAILYRPPKRDFLKKLVGEARHAPGIEPVPTNLSGVKRIIRMLREGHTFGALPDQVPAHGDGVWSDFFGRPAYTITLPVKVARQFDAIRIFAWGERSGRGWKVRAVEWTEPLTGDMQKDVDAMNRMIESIIRRMPAQYAWSYNRYKIPSGMRHNRARYAKQPRPDDSKE